MKPIIGVLGRIDDSCTLELLNTYSKALEDSGALPVVIPYTKNEENLDGYVELCDGFLFSGGVDIEPRRFGEETHDTCGVIQLRRDELEFAIFDRALAKKKPMMAICRGIQLVNVALGGSLYQDIPTEIPSEIAHRQKEARHVPSHSVNVISDTPLAALVGKEKMVANSFHHQAIKTLGNGLCPMAKADDGIIEAVYYTGDTFIRGYQWHPERIYTLDEDNKKLFDEFIDYIKNHRAL